MPFGRHLAWGANPRTQVRVGWQVPHPVGKPFLRFGASPLDLGEKIDAEIRVLHSEVAGAIAPLDQYYLHAALDDLLPGRTYYYSVGHDGFDPADRPSFGRVDSFTTAPSRRRVARPFTFTAFGDQGVSYHALGNDGQVAAQDPAFHLHAGDLCYADRSGRGKPAPTPSSTTRAPGTSSWRRPSRSPPRCRGWPRSATTTWRRSTRRTATAARSPAGTFRTTARPVPRASTASSTATWGSSRWTPTTSPTRCSMNRGYTGGAQTKWLDKRLRFLRGQPDVDFVVVFFHHCAYSTTANHASEGGVREQWLPLFDNYRVDLVINGHNHIYERADVIRGGVPKKTPIGATVHAETDGTTYVTAGAAGRGLYGFAVRDSYAGHEHEVDEVPSFVWASGREKVREKVTWSRVRYTGYSFVAVDVAPADEGRTTTLTLRAVAESGDEIDRVVIARKAGGASRNKLNDNVA